MGACCGKNDVVEGKGDPAPAVRNEKPAGGIGVDDVPVVELPLEGRGFSTQYKLGETLGEGNFAVVKECTHIRTGKQYAVKCIRKLPNDETQENDLNQEITVLQTLRRHPNIIDINQCFRFEKNYYFVVVEYMKGGELFDRIVAKAYYNEKEARGLCRILLDAVKYCHDMGIVHRDLKPENLLLATKADDASIKLADFGFARSIENGPLTSCCGTPAFVAPEILRHHPYCCEPDMWSVGVIIYTLLSGTYPFQDQDQRRLYRKIRAGLFNFHEKYWAAVSSEAKDLIKKLLTVDQNKRYTAAQAVVHPWLLKRDVDLLDRSLDNNLHAFKVTNAKRKLMGAIKSIVAARKWALLTGTDFYGDDF